MTKNKKRKNSNQQQHALFHAIQREKHTQQTTTAAADSRIEPAIVSEDDLRITLRVLNIYLLDSDQLSPLHAKDLRRALHPLVLRQLATYNDPLDYLKRVTLALQHSKWSDAQAALQGARDYQQIPKQGTVQRWVRDVDGAGPCKMKLLSAILRLSPGIWSTTSTTSSALTDTDTPTDNQQDVGDIVAKHVAAGEELTILQGWAAPNRQKDEIHVPTDPATPLSLPLTIASTIVYREDSADRTPPNHYDLLLHTTTPGYMIYTNNPPTILKLNIPFVPGGIFLDGVLTSWECQQLIHAASLLGFRPDHPLSADKPTGIDSCEWFVDDSIRMELFRRVRPHLPSTLQLPQQQHDQPIRVILHQLNARFRCFRYAQDCVYRPHIDGSWPESRLDSNGMYDCDSNGGGGAQYAKSYLTFLLYLNDNFEGGETRFYMPTDVGGMMARGVVPKQGSVLVFPQGNTSSLIHEGSAVTSGTKYVIRTDVLYQQEKE